MLKIMIADDEVIERTVLERKLKKYYGDSCMILAARNGREALELYAEHHPRIMILDIEMPGVNGLEAAKEIRKVSDDTLVGSAPAITKHFIELRGIGIVDVKALFGASSVRNMTNIDLVIQMEEWSKDKEYDRLGLEEEHTEFLGIPVVCHRIPIRPGRNLALICEAAAVNHRQKEMGYNAAQELYKRVQESLSKRRSDDEDE